MQAEIIRLTTGAVDIKIMTGKDMHVLQWRRNMFWDELLLDGKRQAASKGLWGRESIYGLVFGRNEDGEGGRRVIFTIDTRHDWDSWDWDGYNRPRGVRLETSDELLIAFGTLDPAELEKPATFTEAIKKTLGMDWTSER